jgi:predicted dehydrogenase
VAHHLRHQDTYARMQEILNNGELGHIVTAYAEWSFEMNRAAPSAAWKLGPSKNGLSEEPHYQHMTSKGSSVQSR